MSEQHDKPYAERWPEGHVFPPPEPPPPAHQGLIRYDAMCQAIAAAWKVDEVKSIRDRAVALEHYSRVAKNKEAEARCAEIRLRAEHKAGRILKQMMRNQGVRSDLLPQGTDVGTFAQQIEEHGISPKQAHNWQKLADVPEEVLDQSLAQSFIDNEIPTTSGLVAAANPQPDPQPKTIDAPRPLSNIQYVLPATTWFAEWLREFERQGYLTTDPHALLDAMIPADADYVHRFAPQVSDWLWQFQPTTGEPEAA